MVQNDHDPIKEILAKKGLLASTAKSIVDQSMRATIQQNLDRFYQDELQTKAFTLPKDQKQFLRAIYNIIEEMPFMAEKLIDYHSFKSAIITLITRNSWKNYGK